MSRKVRRTKKRGRERVPVVREAAGAYAVEAVETEKPVRKNYWLYQSKIDRAKEILEVDTETEALDVALDLLIYGEALAAGTEALAGEAYHDVLGLADEVPARGGSGAR